MTPHVIVTVSDLAWGGKQAIMADLIQAMQEHGYATALWAEAGGEMATRMERLGCAVRVVDRFQDRVPTGPDADLACADLIVCSGQRDAEFAASFCNGMANPPGLAVFRHSGFPITDAERAATIFGTADLLIATSQQQIEGQLRPYIDRHAARPNSLWLYHSPVDADRFSPRPPCADLRAGLRIPVDAPVMICVARLSHEKGHDLLVEAFATATERVTDLHLVIVGDGPERAAIESTVQGLPARDRVRVMGEIVDVRPYLSIATAAVLTSTCDETGPMSLKEAMAMGVPVIATSVGGIPEFVDHGVTGLLAPADPRAIAAHMVTLAEDTTAARRMGQAGRARMVRDFSFDVQNGAMLREFDRLITERAARMRVHAMVRPHA